MLLRKWTYLQPEPVTLRQKMRLRSYHFKALLFRFRQTRPKRRQALMPPKPNELDRT